MAFYENDFYNEPSEFEQCIEDFKETLRKAVKEEIQEELERLRKENTELQEFKRRKAEIEKEHQSKLRDIERSKQIFERELKRKRLSELLGEQMLMGYKVKQISTEKPKCDKCNKGRRIHFTSPSGKLCSEPCPYCGEPDSEYVVAETTCYKFKQYKARGNEEISRVNIFYEYHEYSLQDEFCATTVYNGESFNEIDKFKVVFLNKDDCQRCCDWLNVKNKEAQEG